MKNQFIYTGKAFDHVELFGVRMAGRINPASIVKSRDIDHQGISLPMTDALAQVGWIQLVRRRMSDVALIRARPANEVDWRMRQH